MARDHLESPLVHVAGGIGTTLGGAIGAASTVGLSGRFLHQQGLYVCSLVWHGVVNGQGEMSRCEVHRLYPVTPSIADHLGSLAVTSITTTNHVHHIITTTTMPQQAAPAGQQAQQEQPKWLGMVKSAAMFFAVQTGMSVSIRR